MGESESESKKFEVKSLKAVTFYFDLSTFYFLLSFLVGGEGFEPPTAGV
jgi:hypothetical protein